MVNLSQGSIHSWPINVGNENRKKMRASEGCLVEIGKWEEKMVGLSFLPGPSFGVILESPQFRGKDGL